MVWIKRNDEAFGSFLSDAEVGWQKGGHGVYCHRALFAPPTRKAEGNGKALHPTQKPVPLLEWLIKTYSNENDMVLDFTMGSGSTIIAAINTNRRYIGIEMNDNIYKIAETRINNLNIQGQ